MLIYLLVSLFPLAIYLFFLASLNRRDRPAMIHGGWEAAALLFALSGFLLYTTPRLLNELYLGEVIALPVERTTEAEFEAIYSRWLVIWIVYYVAVVALAALVVLTRVHYRGIYNVDLEGFRQGLVKALEELGLVSRAEGPTLFLYPAPVPSRTTRLGAAESDFSDAVQANAPVPAADSLSSELSGPPSAEVRFDVFPALSHVSLFWAEGETEFRERFQSTLMRHLEEAGAHDNAVAGWLVGIGSMLFGGLFMLVALFAFGYFFPRR